MNLMFWKTKAAVKDSKKTSPEQPAGKAGARQSPDSEPPKSAAHAEPGLTARPGKRLNLWSGQLDTLISHMETRLDALAQRFKKTPPEITVQAEQTEVLATAVPDSSTAAPVPASSASKPPITTTEKSPTNPQSINSVSAIPTLGNNTLKTVKPANLKPVHTAIHHKYTPVIPSITGIPATHGLLERMELKRSALKLAREKRQLIEANLLPISTGIKIPKSEAAGALEKIAEDDPHDIELKSESRANSGLLERMKLKRNALKLAREKRQLDTPSLSQPSEQLETTITTVTTVTKPENTPVISADAKEDSVAASTESITAEKTRLKQAALKLARENRKLLAAGITPGPDSNVTLAKSTAESLPIAEENIDASSPTATTTRAHFDFSRFCPDDEDDTNIQPKQTEKLVVAANATVDNPPANELLEDKTPTPESALPDPLEPVKLDKPGLVARLDQLLDIWAEKLDQLVASLKVRFKRSPDPVSGDDVGQLEDDALTVPDEVQSEVLVDTPAIEPVIDTTSIDVSSSDQTSTDEDNPAKISWLTQIKPGLVALLRAKERPLHVALLLLFVLEIGYIAWDNIRFNFQREKISVGIIRGPLPSRPTRAEKSLLQDSQTEIKNLRQKNEELQTRLEALKHGGDSDNTSGDDHSSAKSNINSGELTIGSKNPKANALSMKQAIEAMNHASGDFTESPDPNTPTKTTTPRTKSAAP